MPYLANRSTDGPSDPGHGPAILVTAWVLTSLCILTVTARVWDRNRAPKVLGWDDWLILAALVIQIVHTSCVTVACHWGAGKHDEDLAPDQMINILKWFWISTTPSLLVSIVARASAAILLVRIFVHKPWFKRFLIIYTPVQIIVGILAIIFIWLQQSPVESVWNPAVPVVTQRFKTAQQTVSDVAQSLFAFADLAYIICPVFIIWRLNMPLHTKLGLTSVLCLSFITFVGAIMKITTSETAHTLYSSSVVVLWAALEQTLVIIISCVPSLRHLTQAELPRIKTWGTSIVRLVTTDQSRRGSSESVTKSNHSGGGQAPYSNLESQGHGSYTREGGNTLPVAHDDFNREAIGMGYYTKRTEQSDIEHGQG